MKIRDWLTPFSIFYACGVYAWEASYRFGVFPTRKLSVPVIGIGNITVGGSGKTPLTISLAQYVHRQGKRPGILSRGYGGSMSRSSGSYLFQGEDRPGPELVGDEPALMARKLPDALFAISADRFRGGMALQKAGADLVILDDGFQSLELYQDLKIVFVPDGDFGSRTASFFQFLPAGSFRDFPSRLGEADILAYTTNIRTGSISHMEESSGGTDRKRQIGDALSRLGIRQPPLDILGVGISLSQIVDVNLKPAEPLEDLHGKKVVLVSGIARPERFRRFLEEYGVHPVGHLVLPDHVSYSASRIAEIRQWIEKIEQTQKVDRILTTEKDLVKWSGVPDPDGRIRGVSITMDWIGQKDWTRPIDRVLFRT
ncbi:MAG: tetraacyldisaccharide 4'-kinase [Leptospirales bacterium]